MKSSRSRPPGTLAWCVVFGLAIALGTWLRWYQLRIQVTLDDEWHAIHKMLSSDAWGIFTSFGYADHSIPLTLYDRFLLLHDGVTEWGMHWPMLLCGTLLLVAVPILLKREIALPERATWVALLAIAPLLVYHSKVARPYAITGLLVPLAVIAFRRWWRGERHAPLWGASYVVATFLAGWLHLVTVIFTFLPFVYYGVRSLLGAHRKGDPQAGLTGLRRLVFLGLLTLLPLAAVLTPPFVHDWPSMSAKAGVQSVTPESVYRTVLMLFGIGHPGALIALVPLTAIGAWRSWRRDRELTGYIATILLVGAFAIAAARPTWIQHPGLYGRYLLPVLPFLLLFTAEGIVAVLQRFNVGAPLGALAVVAMVAALFWVGPIPGYIYYPNQFMGHLGFQFDYDPEKNPYLVERPKDPVPEFYRNLGKSPPGSITLIEAPWRLESDFNPHPWYQQVHRQKIKIGLVTPVCGVRTFGEYPASVSGMHLHQFAHLSEVLAGKHYGADYLVMHLAAWRTPPDAIVEWPDVKACLPTIEAALGAPVYQDAQIVVFDLKRGAGTPEEKPST
jgi:hypothetical protein